jgi:DNA-binding response OmpR family regulator
MKSPSHADQSAKTKLTILVVDTDPRLGDLIYRESSAATAGGGGAAGWGGSDVRVATGVDAADLEMRRSPAEVVFVNLQIGDNAGIGVIKSFKARWPRAQIIAVSRLRGGELCIEAWRAGAADMLLAPLGPEEVRQALAGAVRRRGEVHKLAERNVRLRVVCRRLNKARREISQQVDLLCNDLVRAYQEMAQQLNVSQLSAEYLETVKSELEVEGILRKTMEWVLRKLGPVNAAVYLPAGDEFLSLGAYLNLDTHADAALIEALGKTVVEQARRGGAGAATTFDDDAMLTEMFAEDAQALLGKSWLAVGCHTARECMGVLVIFRKQEEGKGSDAGTVGLMEAIAPVLATRIEQALSFYHRLHPFTDEGSESSE